MSADTPSKSCRRKRGRRRRVVMVDASIESPASPDVAAMVTGSPVKIIPASPPPPSAAAGEESRGEDTTTGEEEEDEEEDIDEDLLYLRLIALRSMAAEENAEGSKERMEKQVLAKEMQELIAEAEEAASYEFFQSAGMRTGYLVGTVPTVRYCGSDFIV